MPTFTKIEEGQLMLLARQHPLRVVSINSNLPLSQISTSSPTKTKGLSGRNAGEVSQLGGLRYILTVCAFASGV